MYPGLLLNVTDLIMILEIRNDGLHLYTTKKELEFPKYTYVQVVRNICGYSNMFDDVSNIHLRAQHLSLQVWILHSILQHVVSSRMKHTDEVTRLDVALLDYILQRRWVNIGYVILRHMISTPVMNN